MANCSEQDLRYAAEFREGVHREALAIIRRTRPDVTEVVDRHPVEDYFQEHWDYPGRWYTIVAIPEGCRSREALIDAIVRDTLSGEPERANTREALNGPWSGTGGGRRSPQPENGLLAQLLAGYPDLAVDYCIVENEQRYFGYESHRRALKTAFSGLCGDWAGEPWRAVGKSIPAEALFSPDDGSGPLNYRRAFLHPPHETGYTDRDFARVNAALFPEGTEGLAVCEWSTDWSEYFDDGHEWWGALCLTVYDSRLDRFVVILASATD